MAAARLHSTVHLPIFIYAITASLFMPMFRQLTFRKACFDLSNITGIIDCDAENRTELSANQLVQSAANEISMWSSAAMCTGAILSSLVLGRIGDRRSHRLALIVPLGGLIASDVILLLQFTSFPSSTALLVLAEAVFGLCGGYVSILSSAFAYVSVKFEHDERARSVSIAKLEGMLGGGSVIGLLICSQLRRITYLPLFYTSLSMHVICLMMVLLMADLRPSNRRSSSSKRKGLIKESFEFLSRSGSLKKPLLILLVCFFTGYFAFIGSSSILLLYLKSRLTMTVESFSLYRAGEKCLSTITALCLFPYLRRKRDVRNVALAAVGMTTRAATMAWTAVAWSKASLFATLLPEAFSRFASSALRSLMATQVEASEQGRLFSFVALLEAVCHLLATFFVHTVFPRSLKFMSNLPFIIMAALILPAVGLLWWHRDVVERKVENGPDDEEKRRMTSSVEAELEPETK